MVHYENLQLYLWLALKLRKIYRVLEFNQSQWLKKICWIQHKKRIEADKNGDKDGQNVQGNEQCCIWKNNGKLLRNSIDVKLLSNKKDYLKWTSKPSCMPHKIWGVHIRIK